ncbi:MAG: polysaccharide deacetylase family protein [Treponema sp.]|nr:polysaccharide deacetylase family protein [Treponema sp.]
MKRFSFFGYALLMGIFMSCASYRAKAPSVTVPRVPQEDFPGIPEYPPEIPAESAAQMIQRNPPSIKKYFTLDENGGITVRADLALPGGETGEAENYRAVYDLKNLQAGEAGGFWVPFSLSSDETGEVQRDWLFWTPQEDGTGILLSFDDNYYREWEGIFDLLDNYGAKVTFFVQGAYNPFSTEALKRGHDIGYHTLNHLELPKVSRDVFARETLSEVEIYRNAGVPLVSFAYPFGLSEQWMHGELFKKFKILRGYGVTYRLYDPQAVRDGYIIAKSIDTFVYKRDEDFYEAADLMLKTVRFLGGNLILPLATHTISDTAIWGISLRRLEYLLQRANDLGLRFYLYGDFAEE